MRIPTNRTAGLVVAAAFATTALLAAPAHASVLRPDGTSLCGWNPANDSHLPGASGTDKVYSTQGGCGPTQALWGDYVVVHCYAYSAGQKWFYLYDAPLGLNGWESAGSVTAPNPVAC